MPSHPAPGRPVAALFAPLIAGLIALALLLCAPLVHAASGDEGAAAATAGGASAAAASGSSVAAGMASAAALAASMPGASEPATLFIFNRPIVRFRATVPGATPADRVRRANEEIERVMRAGGAGEVGSAYYAPMTIVSLDGQAVFVLLPADLSDGQRVESVMNALKLAMQESRESRSLTFMLRAGGLGLAATLLLVAVVWLLTRLRRVLQAKLTHLGERHGAKIALGGARLLTADRVFGLTRAITTLVFWLLVLVAFEQWLGFAFRLFPYTRRWGEEINDAGLDLAGKIVGAILHSLPGIAVAIVIFVLARLLLRLVEPLFAQVERGELTLSWIDSYTARATRSLVHIGVWLFALAMAYPYLPGSDTEAFKGISVLIGLMLSLGSSNVIGQAISGLIIIYSRTLRVGEYVRIGDVEGTVTATGTFAIRIRTGMGEELTLPNSLIVNQVTKNYSRNVKGEGWIVDTTLTIGYDTPWRQVHAMMIEAARRTASIIESPAPHVFQTALSDFYVEYRLVAQALASQPRPRAQVIADLHANLLDVFNENGVQIMSPHYLGDPGDAKVVAPAKWDPPLAAPHR